MALEAVRGSHREREEVHSVKGRDTAIFPRE